MAPPKQAPSTPKNTLYNYFSRTPTSAAMTTPTTTNGEPTPSTPSSSNNLRKGEATPKSNGTPKARRRGRVIVDDEDEESDGVVDRQANGKSTPKSTPSSSSAGKKKKSQTSAEKKRKLPDDVINGGEENERKKRKIVKEKKKGRNEDDGGSEEDEYRPPASDSDSEEESVEGSPEESEVGSEEDSEGDSGDEKPSRNKKNNSVAKKKADNKQTPSRAKAAFDKFAKGGGTAKETNGKDIVSGGGGGGGEHGSEGNWPHLKYDFLKPDKIRDANRKRPDDPEYDPRTLHVPDHFLDQQTPALRQWWVLKSQNYDTVLFFKMGKFFEFFHMDAVIACKELLFAFMKGEHCHAGFPEIQYPKFSNILMERGYKIARIEQMETPAMMDDRLKDKSRSGRKVQKYDKVVQREVCQLSTAAVRTASFREDSRAVQLTPPPKYLYAVYEKVESSTLQIQFGICFVDTSIGEFYVGQFDDDRHFSRLRTVLAHHPPVQILLAKGNVGKATETLLNSFSVSRKEIRPSNSFMESEKVLITIKEGHYFDEDKTTHWPQALLDITEPGQTTAVEGWELGVQALGGVINYLTECLVEYDILSLKRFSLYKPVDQRTTNIENEQKLPSRMVLDGVAIQNLDVKESPNNLLDLIDYCCTSFGKRLLHEWICIPLTDPQEIEKRLDAVAELRLTLFRSDVESYLKTLPDLERLLNKVHILGSAHRSQNHPDGRAIMFEEARYTKNKIKDLLLLLKSFTICIKVIAMLGDTNPKSNYLKEVLDLFPMDLTNLLQQFENSFDRPAAEKHGKIIPEKGVDSEYDTAIATIAEINSEAQNYLKEQNRQLRCKVIYFGSDKKAFQLEVPERTPIPDTYELSSTKKGYKRYVNDTTKEFVETLQGANAKRDEVLKDITRRIFKSFDDNHDKWKAAVDCISRLDAIMSLAHFAASANEPLCRPKIVLAAKNPFLKIQLGIHPCCMNMTDYQPNSTFLGVPQNSRSIYGNFMLLTGPNMGGKSTLMRQVALIAILAHVGCYVPAVSCEMSVIDRIFTRLGAADNIGEGESTFFVELSETSAILKHCTQNSLVIMDELGRGTATYDGTAIAHAVATKLAQDGVRTLFSTHYHTLVESLHTLPGVQLAHMACQVDDENEDDPILENIAFLYKIRPGACPKSYGFNAAKLAGLPDDVIRCGHQKAKEFEVDTTNLSLFRQFANTEFSLETALNLLNI